MNKHQFYSDWEDAVQSVERMRRYLTNPRDNKKVQDIIIRLLRLGKSISARINSKKKKK